MNEYKAYLSDLCSSPKTDSVSDNLIKQVAELRTKLMSAELTLKYAIAAKDKLQIEKDLLLTLVRK